ncbi:MAG: hypothetical protein NZ942_01435 [Candidatus Aenigmarchaeota archaeon]|nr:hypothetical protein [Candidatus Aenigmarchaeota archaeon]
MEITGFFALTIGTSTLGLATWLVIFQLLRKKRGKEKLEKEIEKISKELDKLYKSLNEETYKSLSLMFLDKTKELFDGQKKFQDAFLFNELKYASLYLEQFVKSMKLKNKNLYLLYKAKHFLSKGRESIDDFYLKDEIERIFLSLESIEKQLS